MTKTRSQSLKLLVKKEEHEEKPNVEQLLHGTKNASKSKSAITKNRKPVEALNAEVKSENADDSKVLLASPKKKTFTKSNITAEQIAKLIVYVVNDKMSVTTAARKVEISKATALNYYHEYQDDPEHKIPLPKTRLNKPSSMMTQQKVEDLIRYIVNDGMNVNQAAKKIDIGRRTAAKYYAKYLEDPKRKIPLLADHTGDRSKRYTQEEIADLIGYIVRDKMSLVEASKKVNMSLLTAKRYYLEYLENPNHEIPDPCESNQRNGRSCTDEQISSLIGYIVDDGMTLMEASVKADVSFDTARKYYKQYLDDPEKCISTPENNTRCVSKHPPTIDQMKNFFSYVIIEKLTVAHAAHKAKIPKASGYKYYSKYLKNPSNQINIKDMTYSANKMKRLVALVQKEKMSLVKAADAVDLNIRSARKYYQQYLKNPQYEFPAIYHPQYTQEDIRKLIDYIRNDKMSVNSAANEIKMSQPTALKYYKEYKNDPEHKIPVPMIRGQTIKDKTLEKYVKIIADIYRENPLIKPLCGSHHPEVDTLDVEIKEELKEEDTKMALIDGK